MPAAGSPLSAALDPRVDEQTVQEVMQAPVAAEDTEEEPSSTEQQAEADAGLKQSV
ncbi:hypothetical protein D3C80_1305610 [compost metagenome]